MHITKFEILAAGLGLISPVVHAVTQASPQYNFIYGACGKITNFNSVFPYYTSYRQGDVIQCQSDCSSYGSAFSATGNDGSQQCWCSSPTNANSSPAPILASVPNPNAALCNVACTNNITYACGGNSGSDVIYNVYGHVQDLNVNIFNDHNVHKQLHKVYDYLVLDIFYADFNLDHHKCRTYHHPPT
ncbi:hypothetical protein CFIO01_00247 [Colletotrichum fioriniae PJ7]|uniref:WSC domain-containing protein n=1 Tax=Colletotrichum fioriniae PJ7 TaxID=1445577 RepID=A0A010QEF3_9PEZI|nr:hypothetical protein CFIO01_00247 [Colletotrichum fioriniae PJ7]